MGLLSSSEMGPAVRQALRLNQTKLAARLGTDDRTLRGIFHQDWPHKPVEKALCADFRELFLVFWTERADSAVDRIREESDLSKLNEVLGLAMEVEYQTLSAFNPASSSDWQNTEAIAHDARNDLFGRTYVAAAFYAHIGRGRQTSINPHEALKRQAALVDKLICFLDQRPEKDVPTSLLRFKISLDRISLFAELTPTAEELAALVDKTKFFEAICAYNNTAPRLWKAPWNGLSIASRLRRRGHYEDFLRRLLDSKKFKSVEAMRKHNTWDSDFDDFDVWYAETHPAKEERNSHEKETDHA